MRERRASESPEVVTRRESEGLRLLAQGFSHQEIAHSFSLGEKTIKTYVSNMLAVFDNQRIDQAPDLVNQKETTPLLTNNVFCIRAQSLVRRTQGVTNDIHTLTQFRPKGLLRD